MSNLPSEPSRVQAGFSLPELIVASAAFVVILTSAVTLLIQWQQISGASEGDIAAVEQATKALGQIAEDVRTASYLYHYATVSITDQTHTCSPSVFVTQIPIVTQATPPIGFTEATMQTYFTRGGMTDGLGLMGEKSTGSLRVLAMTSDQPYGIDHPRYIVYWLGAAERQLKSRTDRVQAGDPTMSVFPLYRLEASPSLTGMAFYPDSWYDFSATATDCATSALVFTLGTTPGGRLLDSCNPAGGATTIGFKLTRVADVLMEDDATLAELPFILRNPHPWSNAQTISPYFVEIRLRVSRKGIGALRHGTADFYELRTQAYARNVSLAQRADYVP